MKKDLPQIFECSLYVLNNYGTFPIRIIRHSLSRSKDDLHAAYTGLERKARGCVPRVLK